MTDGCSRPEVEGPVPVSIGAAMIPPVPDLLDPPGPGEWWSVLHTLSNREKRVAQVCEARSIRYFLPLRRVRRRRDRRSPALFPGYLFACLGSEEQRILHETRTIANVITVVRPEELLMELRQIRNALAAGADLDPGPALVRGCRVRVVSGQLEGLEGVVFDRRNRRGRIRVVLNVSLLGLGGRVELEAEDVEPLPASSRRRGPGEPGVAGVSRRHRATAVI